MSIKLNYLKKTTIKLSSNIVLFCDEKYTTSGLKKYLSKTEFSYINDLLKTINLKENLFVFDINSKKKIVLVSIKKNIKISDVENLGAEFYKKINHGNNSDYFVISDTVVGKIDNFLGHFLHGLKLKSYEFKKYKTKKDTRIISINISGNKNKPSNQNQLRFKALEEGTFYARDLVSEPGNILHPDEYAKRLISLRRDGLKVSIYDEKKLKKLGMYSLLGVGQGSIRGSYLVTMEWYGAKNSSKPLAFVGKGVCFDTGGYSLKPAKFMEDMTYDMAGSATVVGLMKNFALRKAKINAVGVVGLVENMVSGNAQRPGDIV
jgi:Leucyl aminopeptidase